MLCIARQLTTISLWNNKPSTRGLVVSLENVTFEHSLLCTTTRHAYASSAFEFALLEENDFPRRGDLVLHHRRVPPPSAASHSPRRVSLGAQNLGQPPTHDILVDSNHPMILQSSFGLLVSPCSFKVGHVHPGQCVMFCAQVFSGFFGDIPGDFLVGLADIIQ